MLGLRLGGGGLRIEISHRDILLTFLDRPYLPTFSPVNMMMNNISWRAAEYVAPGKSPGSLCLLPMSSSFLCTTLFSESGDRLWGGGAGKRRGNEVDNRYRCAHTHTHSPQKHTRPGPSSSPSTPPKHFHINNQAIFLHANPSKRAGANLQPWGWVACAASSFQVCPTPCRHLSRYVAHKAPALSALIDQRPAVKEESGTPYQWCSTSAPEKSLRLLPQHAQCRR